MTGDAGLAPWPGDATGAGPAAPALATASYGARAGAAAVDLVVRYAIVLAFGLVVMLATGGGAEVTILFVLLGAILTLPYAPIMMTRTGGQTVGHRATGTRVVKRDGTPVTGGSAVTREVLVKALLIEGVGGLVVVPVLLNYLWPLWDDQDETWHDKLCGTRVVDA